jgi:GNAT superfamily N-acetyltransferase
VTDAADAAAVSVRRTGPDDVPLLIELRRAWSAESTGHEIEADAEFVAAFTDWYLREAEQRITWIAEVEGQPVGMLNMLVYTRMPRPRAASAGRASQWGYIANVFVLAGHRNRQVGQRLLDAAIDHADDEGFVRVLLSPSERSVPFYARAGFGPATRHMVRPAPTD